MSKLMIKLMNYFEEKI